MGYSELDYRLMDAWHAMRERVFADPEVAAAVFRRHAGKLLSRPLRSWALVLRASDARIPEENGQGVVAVDAERVRGWCGQVAIEKPGVSMDEAALRFGVNRTTVGRWATPTGHRSWKAALDAGEAAEAAAAEHDDELARCRSRFGTPTTRVVKGRVLHLSYTINRSNRKRDAVRVWTPTWRGVDPGGEVWGGYWDDMRQGLVDKVPAGFAQTLTRVNRQLSARTRVWQWVCPVEAGGCGGLVYKLYYALPVWTLMGVLGGGVHRVAGDAQRPAGLAESPTRGIDEDDAHGTLRVARYSGFTCLKCAGLLYESSERTSVPGRRRDGSRRAVDTWDRFIKRISSGVLTRKEVGRVGAEGV